MPSRSTLIAQARLMLALLVCALGLSWVAPVLAAQGGPGRAAALDDLCASVMAVKVAGADAGEGDVAPVPQAPHSGLQHQHDQCSLCAGASLAPPTTVDVCGLLITPTSAPVRRLLPGQHSSLPAQQQARAPPAIGHADLG